MSERFTDQLWQEAQPLWQAIREHPFLRELKAGTLPIETFQLSTSSRTITTWRRSGGRSRRRWPRRQPASSCDSRPAGDDADRATAA